MACSPRMLRMMRWTEGHDETFRYRNHARLRSGPLPMNDLERTGRSRDLTKHFLFARVPSAQLRTFRRCDIVQRMLPLLATTATAAIQLPCKVQLCTSGGNLVAARCSWCLSEVVIHEALRQRTANGREVCTTISACRRCDHALTNWHENRSSGPSD